MKKEHLQGGKILDDIFKDIMSTLPSLEEQLDPTSFKKLESNISKLKKQVFNILKNLK